MCPVEIKLLLAPPAIKTAIPSMGFEKATGGRVYFFDTNALGLLKQGVIVRVRQGGKNDLTVKVRVPEGNGQVDTSRLREQFGCEIDRTAAGEDVSFAVGQRYKPGRLPELGVDILNVLNPQQTMLLQEAGVSIDWSQVRRIGAINSTAWETTGQRPFHKLALELWEWPAGSIIELSAKVGPDEGQSKFAELQQLANTKGLLLNANQGTKTSLLLETLGHETSHAQ